MPFTDVCPNPGTRPLSWLTLPTLTSVGVTPGAVALPGLQVPPAAPAVPPVPPVVPAPPVAPPVVAAAVPSVPPSTPVAAASAAVPEPSDPVPPSPPLAAATAWSCASSLRRAPHAAAENSPITRSRTRASAGLPCRRGSRAVTRLAPLTPALTVCRPPWAHRSANLTLYQIRW